MKIQFFLPLLFLFWSCTDHEIVMEKAILKRESVKDSVLSFEILSQKENEKGLEFSYEVTTSSESGKIVVRKNSIYLDKTGDGLFVESIEY